MKQNEKNSQKAQELNKEELENVNGGVGRNKHIMPACGIPSRHRPR